jgi:hypothetical protein
MKMTVNGNRKEEEEWEGEREQIGFASQSVISFRSKDHACQQPSIHPSVGTAIPVQGRVKRIM